MRQLKRLQVELLHDAKAHGVQACEHPAATRTLLVGDVALRELDVEGARIEAERLGDAGDLAYRACGNGILCDARGWVRGKGRMRITGDLVGDGGVGDRAFDLIHRYLQTGVLQLMFGG